MIYSWPTDIRRVRSSPASPQPLFDTHSRIKSSINVRQTSKYVGGSHTKCLVCCSVRLCGYTGLFLIILLLGGGDNGFFCGQEEDHEALCGTFHCTSLVSNLMPWRPDGMQVFLPKLAPGDFR